MEACKPLGVYTRVTDILRTRAEYRYAGIRYYLTLSDSSRRDAVEIYSVIAREYQDDKCKQFAVGVLLAAKSGDPQ